MRLFTQSELKTFRNCRRRWWLGNIVRIRPKKEFRSAYAANVGTLVHGALEHQDSTGEHWSVALDASEWLEALMFEDDEFENQKKQSTKEHRQARVILEGYEIWLENTGADQFLETIAVEEKISAPWPDRTGTGLLGKLDKRVRHTEFGTQSFIDYKTGDLTTIPKYADMDEQFLHYSILLSLIHPDDEVYSGIWRMMVKSMRTDRSLNSDGSEKTFFGEHEKRFNEAQLDSYRIRINAVIDDILKVEEQLEAGADHRAVAYPRPTRDWGGCGSCEFFAMCSMFDDGSRVEAFIEEYYEHGDPLDRYAEDVPDSPDE